MSASKKVETDHTCQNCNKALLAQHYSNKHVVGLLGDIAVRTGGDIRLHDHGTKPVSVIWHWRPCRIEYPRIEYGHTAQEALERVLEFLDDFDQEVQRKTR